MQVLLMAALVTTVVGVSTPDHLNWSNHYAEAKVDAAAKQRPLLVVLEDTSDPNGRFDQDGLASKADQVELLQQYHLCRMDVSTDYGKRVAAAFGAKKFPFTATTDRSAQYITFQTGGAMSPAQWEQMLASRKNGDLVMPSEPIVQRVEASKVITDWPSDAIDSAPSNCPNCVRSRYYR